GDTVCRPASSVIATKGTPRQILAKITQIRAHVVSPRKLMFWVIRPICFKDHEMIENWESKIQQNASRDSTVGTMKGISTSARTMNQKPSQLRLCLSWSHALASRISVLARRGAIAMSAMGVVPVKN